MKCRFCPHIQPMPCLARRRAKRAFLVVVVVMATTPASLATTTRGADATSVTRPPDVVWWEELEDDTVNFAGPDSLSVDHHHHHERQRRPWFSTKALSLPDNDDAPMTAPSRHRPTKADTPSHPLRSPHWNVTMQWRRQRTKHRYTKCQDWRVEFSENGYVCMTCHDNNNGTPPALFIGKWQLGPSGLVWELELPSDYQSTACQFWADLHLYPFGDHAKLTHGVVVGASSSAQQWFRPIVATFQGRSC